jgi:hypothetical protein
MRFESQVSRQPRRNSRPLVLAGVTALIACGASAHAEPAQGGGPAATASPQCGPAERRDAKMGMCMRKAGQAKPDEVTSQPAETTPPVSSSSATPSASSSCPSDQRWDPSMNMCVPGDRSPKTMLMFQLNQFAVYSSTSGPRGKSRVTGPGSWMLTYDDDITAKNHLSIDVMASPEQWTVGDKGTPQLLQTEHIDSMHAHDTIMAVEFRDTVAFGAGDPQKLTFLFAPRGAAAIGPVPFMHRESAEGNPDAPLGHALQDGFHDASTVLGVEYQVARTTLEVTGFSGQNITRPFPIHRLDSYGVRVNQDLDDHIRVGASFADALLPDDTGGAQHNQFIAGWLTTSHGRPGATFKSSFVWAETRAGHDAFLSSFLEEAVYQRGKNKFYGRAEVLQVTPHQLDLLISNGDQGASWVKAFTLGYERTLFEKNEFHLYAGGSYTKDMVPSTFRSDYGADPGGEKLYLRINYMGKISHF